MIFSLKAHLLSLSIPNQVGSQMALSLGDDVKFYLRKVFEIAKENQTYQ